MNKQLFTLMLLTSVATSVFADEACCGVQAPVEAVVEATEQTPAVETVAVEPVETTEAQPEAQAPVAEGKPAEEPEMTEEEFQLMIKKLLADQAALEGAQPEAHDAQQEQAPIEAA